MNWTPYLVAWICFGAATLGLALYRKVLTAREDERLHIDAWQTAQADAQALMARRMHTIDRVGETLTVLTVLGGLTLAIAYVFAVLSRA